jgi:hypothetical protein
MCREAVEWDGELVVGYMRSLRLFRSLGEFSQGLGVMVSDKRKPGSLEHASANAPL